MEALWYVLLAVVAVVFIAMHAFILPRIFLKVRFDLRAAGRGVRVVNETTGVSIVYEPEAAVRKYIYQYIVSERMDKKCLVLRVNDDLKYIAYDVAVFNSQNCGIHQSGFTVLCFRNDGSESPGILTMTSLNSFSISFRIINTTWLKPASIAS